MGSTLQAVGHHDVACQVLPGAYWHALLLVSMSANVEVNW